ncbi:cathepsin O [Antennarius striatus]|uniref:cathepsin O n=1 Tax=Antennarius striatus TaxID=241820 RepID=UPI0035B36753
MTFYFAFLTVITTLSTFVALFCCQNLTRNSTRTKFNDSNVDFEAFREIYLRTDEVNSEELKRRLLYFQDAKKRQAYLNSFSSTPESAKYGINQFSDLSQQEFRDLYLQASADRAPLFSGLKAKVLPASFDWRDRGVVAPVQDQKACGGCWAFSVVHAIQSVHAIDSSQLVEFSVQQVLDCSYQSKGCSGGSTVQTLSWLKQTRMKLVPEEEYPYKAKTGLCHFFSQSHGGFPLKNYTAYDFSGKEKAMMDQLFEHGPLSVIVDAVSWQDYQGGIIQHHCSSRHSNHAVLIVGYNTAGSIPYWIVQNSWGTSWGNEGYVYIKIGGNVCGIADSVAAVFL